MDFRVLPITEADARAIVGWRYDGPYAAYDCPPEEASDTVRLMLDPATQYHAVHDERGGLVGSCCFGPDARVPGGDYSDDSILDVGFGLRPELTGRGNGPVFVEAIVSFARTALGRRHLRVTAAAWNRRAIRVYEKAGFRTTLTFTHGSPGGLANGSTDWWQMTRDDRTATWSARAKPSLPNDGRTRFELRWLGPTDY